MTMRFAFALPFAAAAKRLAAALASLFAFAGAAHAQIMIDVTQGHLNPTPIAIPDFIGGDAAAASVGRDVAGVIRADLERSGLFNSIDPAAFIERVQGVDIPPRFADWKVLQ